jgi:cell division protein FtsW
MTVIEGAARPARRHQPTARRRTQRGSATFVALLAAVVGLNLFGLVMVLSASSVTALDEHGSAWFVAVRQAAWLSVGAVAMVVAMNIDYRRWRRWATPLLVLAGALMVLVLVPGVGREVNGATRWLGVGQWSLQPSELAKLAVVLFVADLLARRSARIESTRLTVVPVTVVFGVFAALLLAQPNLGTTIVLGASVMAVLLVSGVRLAPLAALAALGAGAATVAAFAASYRRERVFAFLDPWHDPLNTGYQNIQSLVGLANGGLTGTGLGASRAKWGFLPFAHTDFIFSIVGEELGFLGALTVVAGFAALVVLGIRTAAAAPDCFGALLAAGITAWLGVQAFVNIGAVVGILPITGIPLPFLSYGGSSLVVALAASGLLLSVARQARVT